MSASDLPVNAVSSTESPLSEVASLPVKMPFRGYKHLGGLLSGLTAGILALVVPLFNKDIHFMGVGMCAIGALNAYMLSLMNRSLMGALAGLNGGFFLGLISYGVVALFASDPAVTDSELMPRIYSPFLFASLCPLLGAGPLAIAMFFQQNRPKGMILRLLLATIGGGMAAAAGLVVTGMSSTILSDVLGWTSSEQAPLVLGFTVAGYVLFRMQVLFMLESASGDKVERPGMEEPSMNAPEPPKRMGRDDEP